MTYTLTAQINRYKVFRLSEAFTWDGEMSEYVVLGSGSEIILGDESLGLFLATEYGRMLSWSNILHDKDTPEWAWDLALEI